MYKIAMTLSPRALLSGDCPCRGLHEVSAWPWTRQTNSELVFQQDPFPKPAPTLPLHPPPCSLQPLHSVMALLCSSITAAAPVAPGQIFPLGNAEMGERELCWAKWGSSPLTPALWTAETHSSQPKLILGWGKVSFRWRTWVRMDVANPLTSPSKGQRNTPLGG